MIRFTTKLEAARRALLAGATLAASLAAGACSLDSILKNDELPPTVTDPAITKTREGSIAAYHGLIQQFRAAFGSDNNDASVVAFTGLLSDELLRSGTSGGDDFDPLDARSMLEGVENGDVLWAFGELGKVRGQATQAIGLLTRYAPEERDLTGHAYTLQALAEIFLAETFCSGIPLSTIDFEGDYTPRPGSSTEEVYEHALALLDTAFTLVEDSVRFVHLAHMAQARALVGLGRLDDAAAAVAGIPDDWRYEVTYVANGDQYSRSFAYVLPSFQSWAYTVADREGTNGLDYRTSGDPRTRATLLSSGGYHPERYRAPGATPTDGSMPIPLATGLEARLIEAEADLAAGGTAWLDILNTLRTNGEVVSTYTREDRRGISTGGVVTQEGSPGPAGVVDTTWGPGTGSWIIPASVMADTGPVCPTGPSPGHICTDTVWYKGLRPLADPVDPAARVDLLFRERAFWLFLTGHRQADLRRLIRHYGRSDTDIYPTGEYPAAEGGSYGNDVNAPIPIEESASNPHFTGCISRGA